MTLVSPLQLLLFECKKITSNGDIVELDEWIKLRIPHHVAGGILALRAALEAQVVEVTKDPEYIRQMDPTTQRLINLIRQISNSTAMGMNMMKSQRYKTAPRIWGIEQIYGEYLTF
ncbi:ATP-dependent RNA helicase A-like [Boleophthalmus pectinirostris]|uniref:ATP-dependent RNA helicase A-like n=1 Tax=Boleophthalmus pectinirostris TaxID=150288 RepID=UPI002430A17A|nr:ATP-dependent RNA helicase A-like [Boleophthalmus pectinirostris]